LANARSERTRQKILDAAERLLLEHGLEGAGMESVAAAAGVSRQAVYDKFGSKGGLLRAMNQRVESRIGIPQVVAGLAVEADGLTRLNALFELGRRSEPAVAPFVRVIYAARLHDETAAELWHDRINARHRAMSQVVEQLDREGKLRPGLDVRRGTDILWSILHPLNYDNLVAMRGWSIDEYRRHVEAMARASLLGEPPPPWVGDENWQIRESGQPPEGGNLG
jgi:AcrR family transcriptional regulator